MSIRRDYKPAATGRRRRQVVRRHGLLVGALVLIGLFGGLLAYIKGDRQSTPATAAVPAVAPETPPAPKAAPETPPAPIKPKYDFYTELPKRQIEIQRGSRQPQGARQNPPAEPPRRPTRPDRDAALPTVAAAIATTV